MKINLTLIPAGLAAIAVRDSHKDNPNVVAISNGVITYAIVAPLVPNA